ncbi:MAG: hypothetical protein J6V24_09910, partial [Clostridia bacterium]|nr:hypothetical protein [Clostridia bacterium]
MSLLKKTLAALGMIALIVTVLALPAAAAGDENPSGIAVKGTPEIDGVIDDAWANVPAYPVDRLKDGSDTGITSQFRVMWQENALYVLIEVNDKDHSFSGGPS